MTFYATIVLGKVDIHGPLSPKRTLKQLKMETTHNTTKTRKNTSGNFLQMTSTVQIIKKGKIAGKLEVMK